MATSFPFIAALSAEIQQAGSALKLLPAGDFRARDGRPTDFDAWHLDAELAQTLIAAATARETPYVIDYEHQTLNAATNGQPAPAAAWFSTLEWRDGDGLYATDVQWTERASAMIAASEYRFLSPVFRFDSSGNVVEILHAALTNNPALDCLNEVTLTAASLLAANTVLPSETPVTPSEDLPMNELLEQLSWLLNMPVGATADDVKAQLQKLIDALSNGQGTAATKVDLLATLAQQKDHIAALSANQIDPAKYVSVSVMTDLRQQLDEANQKLAGRELDELVTAALSDGRLLPAQESWARDLGKSNLAALKTFVETASPVAALSGTQTGGKAPTDSPAHGLSESQLAVCHNMGIAPEDYKKLIAAA